ncbi:zinc finger protein MAGPIE-like isoform X2 [Salvia miltiorrhiza]|uniref:zinc finger protein MAGPIE-like isoform X2 n=1 Tax=Salvia miltiorrhiza TaxID=226208 RepID=UPI0025AC41CA|nr:zinc finger protein MAGPIE-like isoform X2 [Salvia miltiorrhiza]
MPTEEEAATSITSTQNDAVRGSNPPVPPKKKRNLPGNPDPEAEVIALSPKTLMATNRFVCEICGKGFQREQNLQLHKRGHNLPWKLKQRTSKEVRKRVYVCPEKTCVHHHASRALGDLTGIKKHFCRKHGEKKWKCDKCAKHYAVHSDWKAHYKTCGTREYKCDCGTIFSRRDSFITHRAFCDALAEETARFTAASHSHTPNHFITSSLGLGQHHFPPNLPLWVAHGNQQSHDHNSIAKHLQEMHHQFTLDHPLVQNPNPPSLYQTANWGFGRDQFPNQNPIMIPILKEVSVPSLFHAQNQNQSCAAISATALLQRAAQIGATTRDGDGDKLCGLYGTTSSGGSGLGSDVELSATLDHEMEMYPPLKRCRRPVEEEIGLGETRDFLGVGMHTICNPSAINGWI